MLIAGVLMAGLYATLTACLYFLGARALLTRPIWSRYPPKLDNFMICAACSGFWYGLFVGGVGALLDLPFLVLPGRFWLTPVVVGLCSIIWTPWLASKHLAALETTSPPAPPKDYSPEAYGTDASPTKDADLAYARGDLDDDQEAPNG
jgi:hypothetical protein